MMISGHVCLRHPYLVFILFFSYITINHQPYIALHFFQNIFVCYIKDYTGSNINVSYLDLSIRIVGNKYGITIFDKRDTFNFKIVIFPSMSI